MGEAKRRNKLNRQLEAELRARLQAGDFGPAAERCVVVVDKSAAGRDLLLALRAMPEFAALHELLPGEAFQMWEASPLFEFIVLCSGNGKPPTRALLAADAARLLGEVLPRALRQFASPGLLIAVDDAALRSRIEQAKST